CLLLIDNDAELATLSSSAEEWGLWSGYGGRCEFDNCNEYLLEHKPTGTPGYYAEQAHIWAFSERGPRGRAKGRPASIHHIDNLMLLCKACHAKIDNEPTVYTV